MDPARTPVPAEETLEYKVPGENWINGVRHSSMLTPDVMSRIPEFPVHEDDVFICGFPKSGNVWTTTIVSAILRKDDLNSWLETPPVTIASLIDVSLDQATKTPRPSYFRSHLPYYMLPSGVRENNAKIIHISRDPKDVAVSLFYFHKDLVLFGPWNGPWDIFYDNFISGQVIAGSYFRIVRSYWEQKDNPYVMNIQYENLKRDPKTWIGKLAEFLGKPLETEKLEKIVELTSFGNMKKTPVLNPDTFMKEMEKVGRRMLAPGGAFLRKGVIGDWRHLFSEQQRRQTDRLYQQLCKDMGMEHLQDFANEEI